MNKSIKFVALVTIILGFTFIVRPVLNDYLTAQRNAEFAAHGIKFVPKPAVRKHSNPFPGNISI